MCGCVILNELDYLSTQMQIPHAISPDKDTWATPNTLIILKFNWQFRVEQQWHLGDIDCYSMWECIMSCIYLICNFMSMMCKSKSISVMPNNKQIRCGQFHYLFSQNRSMLVSWKISWNIYAVHLWRAASNKNVYEEGNRFLLLSSM